MYDPLKPTTIFEPGNLEAFAAGLTNAYALKHNLGGDVERADLGVCMVALGDIENGEVA